MYWAGVDQLVAVVTFERVFDLERVDLELAADLVTAESMLDFYLAEQAVDLVESLADLVVLIVDLELPVGLDLAAAVAEVAA